MILRTFSILALLLALTSHATAAAPGPACRAAVMPKSRLTTLMALGADPKVAQEILRYDGELASRILNWKGRREILRGVGIHTRDLKPYMPKNTSGPVKPNSFVTLYRGVHSGPEGVNLTHAGYWWTEDPMIAAIMGRHQDLNKPVKVLEIQAPLFLVYRDGGYPVIPEGYVRDFTRLIRRTAVNRNPWDPEHLRFRAFER